MWGSGTSGESGVSCQSTPAWPTPDRIKQGAAAANGVGLGSPQPCCRGTAPPTGDTVRRARGLLRLTILVGVDAVLHVAPISVPWSAEDEPG
jgi:hypothetical protein